MVRLPFGHIRLLTLDAMDTLIRTSKPIGAIYGEFAHKFGVECDEKALMIAFIDNFRKLSYKKPCYGFGKDGSFAWWTEVIRGSFQDIGVLAKFANFKDFSKQLCNHFATTGPWQLVDAEACKYLSEIRNEGIHIGVISNFDSRLHSILNGFHLSPLIELMLLSGEVGMEKPDSRLFELAAKHFRINLNEILHIGDSIQKDYHGAILAGANALLFDYHPSSMIAPSHSQQPTPSLPSDEIVHSLAQLVQILQVESENQQHE